MHRNAIKMTDGLKLLDFYKDKAFGLLPKDLHYIYGVNFRFLKSQKSRKSRETL